MSDHLYDVALYGASGFVGKQTVRYFARHAALKKVRWAIAGRNRQKLEAVRAEVGATIAVKNILAHIALHPSRSERSWHNLASHL
jgi:short subunit dehydrogenase-like uncharacterized protein